MNDTLYVCNVCKLLQKQIRSKKCLNLYQISADAFFMPINSFKCFSIATDSSCSFALRLSSNCSTSRSIVGASGYFDWSMVGSVVTIVDVITLLGDDVEMNSLVGDSLCVMSMLMPLCFAKSFNNSIASRASRFSCKNLLRNRIKLNFN